MEDIINYYKITNKMELKYTLNIKLLLKNNEFLYQVARKYRRTSQMSSFKYDNAFEKEDIEYVNKKITEEKNLKNPETGRFIKFNSKII